MGRRIGWLVLVCWLICPLVRGEEMYIRVVSRDDSPAAQTEKFQVRDAVLPLIPEDETMLRERLPLIEETANQLAPCRVEIRPWAPEGAPVQPTLYLTIEEGQGPNWWGILYGEGTAIVSRETDSEEISFAWPLIEWLLRILGW